MRPGRRPMWAWIATAIAIALFLGLAVWAILSADWGNAFAFGALWTGIAAVAWWWPE